MDMPLPPVLDIPFKTIIKPTLQIILNLYHLLDIPFKTIIKPTGLRLKMRPSPLDIPFKTIIKPTPYRANLYYLSWIYHSKQ